jgi:FKBP12-rapamycin complex-associated protein
MATNCHNVPIHGGISDAANANNSEDLLLHQAWNHYLNVFKRINAAIAQTLSLELSSCSPKLHTSLDLEVGVPGTYTVKGDAVRIKSFHEVVGIIRSKQRPRKIRVHGEDGQVYVFLLKAST